MDQIKEALEFARREIPGETLHDRALGLFKSTSQRVPTFEQQQGIVAKFQDRRYELFVEMSVIGDTLKIIAFDANTSRANPLFALECDANKWIY